MKSCAYLLLFPGLVGACIILFILSVLYEGLKYMREVLLRRAAVGINYSVTTDNSVMTKEPANVG